MSRPPRFFLPELREGPCELVGPQAHHLLNVLRLRVGDEVELFDGAGRCSPAKVEESTRSTVTVAVLSVQTNVSGLAAPVTLAVALPKPDRSRWLVEKTTELGVTTLVPLTTEFSVSSPGSVRLEKLRQYVIEACRQCGRNTLMTVCEPVGLPDFLEGSEDPRLYFGESGAGPLPEHNAEAVTMVIGPEGGFSAAERELLIRQRAVAASVGPNVLRVETAAVAAAVLLVRR